MVEHPRLMHTALDANDARELAEFYRELMGWGYRPGDEPPGDGGADDDSWLVLVDGDGRRTVAVQRVDEPLARPTWPTHQVPMQLHLDFSVGGRAELERHKDRAVSLGAAVLLDRSHDQDEALYVLADPAGHPFCLLTTA